MQSHLLKVNANQTILKSRHLRTKLLVLSLLLIPVALLSQEIEEKLLEEQAENSEQSELLEILLELTENPIDINKATEQDLEKIPFLTTRLRLNIIQYRKKKGAYRFKEELLLVQGIGRELYLQIYDLIEIPGRRRSRSGQNRLTWRTRITDQIEESEGFKSGAYESSSQKVYNRLRFSVARNIEGGLLLEKDRGERRLDDLRLFYIGLDAGERLSVLVGNYQVEAGQGLVLWGPYGFSKSADAVFPVRKRGRGMRGYSSVDENASLFGGSAAVTAGPVQLTAFVSRNKLDASPISNDEVSSFFTSGFHRNANEKSKKDVVTESLVGGRISYLSTAGLQVGVTAYLSSFDKKINHPDMTRNRFRFRGKTNSVFGFDWKWTRENVLLFGEAARSRNGATALLTGAQFDFGASQLAVLIRDYQRDFQNFHGFGFGNRSGATENERGYYVGLSYRITRTTEFNAFYDIFLTPWRTFFEPLPTQGRDFLGQVEQKLGRHIRITFRFRHRTTQDSEDFRDTFNREKRELVDVQREQWRLQFDYRLSRQVELRSRIEYANFKLDRFSPAGKVADETGLLLYQQIRLQPNRSFQVTARLSFFDTDSFDSRVFQYEHDLPGLLTNRALFGRGTRWYALVKYSPLALLSLSMKYSETLRDDVAVIGSGSDQINSNLDRRFGIQIEVKL